MGLPPKTWPPHGAVTVASGKRNQQCTERTIDSRTIGRVQGRRQKGMYLMLQGTDVCVVLRADILRIQWWNLLLSVSCSETIVNPAKNAMKNKKSEPMLSYEIWAIENTEYV
uniref:Uncharacterized protein n=1 Tax=Caenorhabditis tropicalis TaxID=1561998 RepID=A0A1I7SYD1_9PELO